MNWLPLCLVLQGASADAGPQSAPAAAPSETADPVTLADLVVVARRGAAELPPEVELGEAEIDGLGAWDIGEVIDRTGEAFGLGEPPILIVNGRRVANPHAFLGFPPDALVRVEVLPPQAGGLYGADPSRRVLNIVLKPRFESREGRAAVSDSAAGGRAGVAAEVRFSAISGETARQIGIRASHDDALRVEERPSYLSDRPERAGATLRPASEALAANLTMTRAVDGLLGGAIEDWAASLSAHARTRRDRFALTVDGRAIDASRRTDSLALNGGLGGEAAGWSLRLRLDGALSRSAQRGTAETRTRNLSGSARLSADRRLLDLPAGEARLNLSGRYGRLRSARTGAASRSAETLELAGDLALPLAARRGSSQTRGGPAWGEAAATLGVAWNRTDDAEGAGLKAGLTWSPLHKLRFGAAWSAATESTPAQQRFEPAAHGPPRLVFDFRTGRSVEVLTIVGGDPDLRPSRSRNASLSASAGPFGSWRVLGSAVLQRTAATNAVGAFPFPTPALEAAFPERFTRNADGILVALDQRPINLHESRSDTLTSAVNLNVPMARAAGGKPNASLQASLVHTWRLAGTTTIRQGLAPLDLLAGDGGGTAPHEIALRLDGRRAGWGLNVAARWRAGRRVRRDPGRDGPDDLRLAGFASVDLKLSRRLGSARPPGGSQDSARGAEGVRIALEIDNLFDARPRARIADGREAPGYGRDDQDPLGRFIRLTLNRRF